MVKTRTKYSIMQVLSAACAAQRINGTYLKLLPEVNPGDQKPNRQLVMDLLEDTNGIRITEDDVELANNIKSHYAGLTFKVLSGGYINGFDRDVMKLLEQETTDSFHAIAVMASLPNSYVIAHGRVIAEQRINFAQGGYVGTVGNKLNLSCEVLKCIYSQKYNTYYINAITDNDEVVFFSYKQKIEIGSKINIAGNVKAHRDEKVTQLNRVKVLS